MEEQPNEAQQQLPNNTNSPSSSQQHLVKENEFILLKFNDGKQIFCEATKYKSKTKAALRIHKRTYSTWCLIGLPYGSVVEVDRNRLVPLPAGEDLNPDPAGMIDEATDGYYDITQGADNRHIFDDNKSQSMDHQDVKQLREDRSKSGSDIVAAMVQNSATYRAKTNFSKAKYIQKKQNKYQPRFRILNCTPANVCAALYSKDPRKIMNLREDTLAQILTYANVYAGCQVLIFEHLAGLVTAATAQRMGGYGKILSIYETQQPSFVETLAKFNLTYAQSASINWLHSGEIFNPKSAAGQFPNQPDTEAIERDDLQWPCPLQSHTREYLQTMSTPEEKRSFLEKRAGRFARKLTRLSIPETRHHLRKKSHSMIIITKYDPLSTFLTMIPYLQPSCNFVIYCEYLEPLLKCFQHCQEHNLAMNLRLSDSWYREYQVLKNRTHPYNTMSQSGGFLLTGVTVISKPEDANEELRKMEILKQVRAKMKRTNREGRRRRRQDPNKDDANGENNANSNIGASDDAAEPGNADGDDDNNDDKECQAKRQKIT